MDFSDVSLSSKDLRRLYLLKRKGFLPFSSLSRADARTLVMHGLVRYHAYAPDGQGGSLSDGFLISDRGLLYLKHRRKQGILFLCRELKWLIATLLAVAAVLVALPWKE